MIRDVNLIEHLPKFVADYKQMSEIMNSENPEFQMLANLTEKVKLASFITECDEIGIKRFEKMLNVTPSPDDSLEVRRTRIFTIWNNDIPYTYRYLIRQLTAICGEDGFTLNPNFDEYELELITHMRDTEQMNLIDDMMKKILPANIMLIYTNTSILDGKGRLKFGSVGSIGIRIHAGTRKG